MDIFIGVVVGLIVLMILVVAHEFGHFIVARRNGVRVLEFGIGFPPRAAAWIKDPATHKWRKLKKSEWNGGSITKTVGVEKGKNAAKNTKNAAVSSEKLLKTSGKQKALRSGKNREKIIQDGLIFSINWLPIGGFCQMDGESAEDERQGTFGHANFWQKTKILFAGVLANWLVAFVILTVLAWTGMPTFLDNQFTVASDTKVNKVPVMVKSVHEDSPAAAAGFKENDYILKVNGTEVWYGSDITAINNQHAGESVTYGILRDGTEYDLIATLNTKDSDYLLGISMESSQALSYSTWSAPITGAGLTLQLTGETFKGLGELVYNLISGVGKSLSFDNEVRESGHEAIESVGDSVTGPVGIIGVLFPSFTSAGPTNLAFLAALISVSLACMNVLPIPALDGGRWFLIALFKVRKKRLTKEIEEKIVARAFMVLLALIVIVTILDIVRFFK